MPYHLIEPHLIPPIKFIPSLSFYIFLHFHCGLPAILQPPILWNDNLFPKMIDEAHYQYPSDTTDADKIIQGRLQEYRESLEQRLSALVPKQDDLKVTSSLKRNYAMKWRSVRSRLSCYTVTVPRMSTLREYLRTG